MPTEYKSSFEPLTDQINILNPPLFRHAKYSQQAFEKNKSYLSQYGSNLISPTSF